MCITFKCCEVLIVTYMLSTSSCTVHKTACNSKPCLNGGTCSVVPKFNETGHYFAAIECKCMLRYEGKNCESEYKSELMKGDVTRWKYCNSRISQADMCLTFARITLTYSSYTHMNAWSYDAITHIHTCTHVYMFNVSKYFHKLLRS